MRNKKSVSEYKIASGEMRDFLHNFPASNIMPSLHLDRFLNNLKATEQTISRLSRFRDFLASLNPTAYLKWMMDACANWVAGSVESLGQTSVAVEEQAALPKSGSKSIARGANKKTKRPVLS